jgi:hypothetical protein
VQIPIDWSKEDERRKLFTWQARVGLAPRFGTCNIQHYQAMHVAAYDVLLEVAREVWNRTHPDGPFKVHQRADDLALRVKPAQPEYRRAPWADVSHWKGLGIRRLAYNRSFQTGR